MIASGPPPTVGIVELALQPATARTRATESTRAQGMARISRTGTGHRHLSSMDFIERQGAVSGELTSTLLAISEKGWPLALNARPKPVKRAANSGELGWRIRVKPGGENL